MAGVHGFSMVFPMFPAHPRWHCSESQWHWQDIQLRKRAHFLAYSEWIRWKEAKRWTVIHFSSWNMLEQHNSSPKEATGFNFMVALAADDEHSADATRHGFVMFCWVGRRPVEYDWQKVALANENGGLTNKSRGFVNKHGVSWGYNGIWPANPANNMISGCVWNFDGTIWWGKGW